MILLVILHTNWANNLHIGVIVVSAGDTTVIKRFVDSNKESDFHSILFKSIAYLSMYYTIDVFVFHFFDCLIHSFHFFEPLIEIRNMSAQKE